MDNANEESANRAAPGETQGAAPDVVHVRLLGGLLAEVRGAPVALPGHEQGPALLAWLALHPGEHPRGDIAALLWPQLAPSNARRELRLAAWSVRRSLGPLETAVLDGRDTLGLRCETDLAAFERALDAGEEARAKRLDRKSLIVLTGIYAFAMVAVFALAILHTFAAARFAAMRSFAAAIAAARSASIC